MPNRPAGAASERPKKMSVSLPTSFLSNEGIGFLKNNRILNVGGDAHIAPPGAASELPQKNERSPSGVIPGE